MIGGKYKVPPGDPYSIIDQLLQFNPLKYDNTKELGRVAVDGASYALIRLL